MATITIGGSTFQSYASLDAANKRLVADFSASAWRAETDEDAQRRALVTASRLLDRLRWPGEKSDPDQQEAFPRVNVPNFEDDEIPWQIPEATILLAKAIHEGAAVETQPGIDANTIKRQKAGSVEQEFFRPGDNGPRLPLAVMELLRGLFGGLASIAAVESYGTDGCSITRRTYGRSAGL